MILNGVWVILQIPRINDVNGSTPRARILIIPIVTAIMKVPIIDITILLSKSFVLGDIIFSFLSDVISISQKLSICSYKNEIYRYDYISYTFSFLRSLHV